MACPHCGCTCASESLSTSEDWIFFRSSWNLAVRDLNIPSIAERETSLSKKLAKAVAGRIKDMGPEAYKKALQDALTLIGSDPFFQGNNDRGWIVNPDYLLRPGKLAELAARMRQRTKPIRKEVPNESTVSVRSVSL